MIPDLHRELPTLHEAASQRLRVVPEIGGYRHVFSIWVKPSFAPAYRCTVYAPLPHAEGTQPVASFTVWRSDLDAEKMRTPVERLKHPKNLAPTMEDHTLWLGNHDLEGFERRLRGIAVPLCLGSTAVVGCDGTSFEFCCDAIFHGASLHWWEDHPAQWRPFTAVVVQIASELEDRRKAKVQEAD